tara:strand:+ start:1095 stop:1523 length:429 start_codon:yes stop_codon:yes gene_type:complete
MKYKQWESSGDRRNESDVARALESRWDCRLHKLPKQYRMDYFATRGGVGLAFIEVKCRTHSSTRYKTLMLSLAKYMAAKTMGQATGLPVFLVSRYTDATKFVSLMQDDFPMSMGGRTATSRDERDLEPIIQIPTERMSDLYE